jgi:N-acetylmuramoyl-L-alanine amidase
MRLARFFLLFSLLAAPLPGLAAVTVHNLRQWQAPDHTRLVFDLSAPVEHRLSSETGPPRLVLDLDHATLREPLPELDSSGSRLASVRAARHDADTLRVVIELKAEIRPRSFLLKPAGPYGHRLVIDLHDVKGEEEARKPAEKPDAPARRELVIAIDAGHGGEDPGAIGRRFRTREKDVTLAIARELARQVAAAPDMKPLLIRGGDYYIGLRERFQKARRHQADVFVSIHADAVPGGHAKGSSVYALSERGASSATAKFIADKENASDLIGGVSLNDKDDVLARVLLDLSHTKTIQDSLELGGDILTELQRVGPVHLRRVAQAGFMVLKSPDIPSVLVETAFITNPTEEKNLRTPEFQQRMAAGILAGIRRFTARQKSAPAARATIATTPRPEPVATREHVVRRGDTLISISRQYKVHVDVLRFFNELGDSDLPVGLRLRIPPPESDS